MLHTTLMHKALSKPNGNFTNTRHTDLCGANIAAMCMYVVAGDCQLHPSHSRHIRAPQLLKEGADEESRQVFVHNAGRGNE